MTFKFHELVRDFCGRWGQRLDQALTAGLICVPDLRPGSGLAGVVLWDGRQLEYVDLSAPSRPSLAGSGVEDR